MNNQKNIKSALMSMMFTWGEPLEAKVAADVLNISVEEAIDTFLELRDDMEADGSGIYVRQIDKAFQLVTNPNNHVYVEKLCTPIKTKRLSQSALEVLAIVAYRQPITRGEIESVRGVKSERIIDGLVQKKLVKEVGRSNALGRPILYGTTNEFLRYMNLESIKQLPKLENIESEIEMVEKYSSVDANQMTIDTVKPEEVI